MKTLLILFVVALLNVSLYARPTDEDFTIDMYQGNNHLRYTRATETAAAKATAGTVVTVEKAATAAATVKDTPAATATKTEKVQPKVVEKVEKVVEKVDKVEKKAEPLKLEDALKLVQTTMEKLEAESSSTSKAETAASATKLATTETKETPLINTITSSSSLISTPRKFVSGLKTSSEESIQLSNPNYINKYGDILYRINADKAQVISTPPVNTFGQQTGGAITRTLAGFAPPQSLGSRSENSRSFSRVVIGGQQIGGNPSMFGSPSQWFGPREVTSNLASAPWGNQKWNAAPAFGQYGQVQTLNFSPRFGRQPFY